MICNLQIVIGSVLWREFEVRNGRCDTLNLCIHCRSVTNIFTKSTDEGQECVARQKREVVISITTLGMNDGI
jgi:hypothetical protein